MKSENVSRRRRVSVRQFAENIFHESLVTGVPSIVKAPSRKRKIFKLCVLALCFAGFLYQTSEFVSFVLTYPSVVDIHVHTPKEFIFPAFTVCNNNGYKRSKFCEAFPEECETPENETAFCNLFPYYCEDLMDWTNFKVPKLDSYLAEEYATLKDLKSLGHGRQPFLTLQSKDDDDIHGPFIFFKNGRSAFLCYTVHSRVNSSSEPAILTFHPLAGLSLLDMSIDFEENETFLPGREPSGLLAIHSPFDHVNPYDYGITIRPGRIYKIHLKLQEEELLPFPYQSSCVNYTQIWIDNGRTGYRSQEMCKQTCLMDIISKSCECTFKELNYPFPEDTCFYEPSLERTCLTEDLVKKLMSCLDGRCKEDCQKYKFFYVAQERRTDEIYLNGSIIKNPRATVHVYALDPEVVVYKYRPHYQNIEVFSYIGGYIGAWLGISLVAVADFFESLFQVTLYAITRRIQGREGPEVTPAARL